MNRPETAFALIEYAYAADGLAAVDRMLKRSPIAVLKCGTVHPGRFLALVGGTVASTEEAWREGTGGVDIADDVFLPDPHPALRDALTGDLRHDDHEAMAVLETSTSPALLRAIDGALKAVPVRLAELRLADDLGGRGLAVLCGGLTDLQAALEIASGRIGDRGELLARSLMPRVEQTLLDIVSGGTRFGPCPVREPEGAEFLPAANGE